MHLHDKHTLNSYFIRCTCLTAHLRKYLMSQSLNSMHLGTQTWPRQPAEIQTKHQSGEEMKVTLNVLCFFRWSR